MTTLQEELRGIITRSPFKIMEEAADKIDALVSYNTEAQALIANLTEQRDIYRAEVERLRSIKAVVATKTWYEDGKVVTQHLTAKDVYKDQTSDSAEIRRVFEIDDAQRPAPDSGFALLGEI